jgi:antitoxin HicB
MYRYAVKLKRAGRDGFVVTFPQFPEAVTQGETRAEALLEAVDCLDEAIAARIGSREAIPVGKAEGDLAVEPSPAIAAKAALYDALRAAQLTTISAAARHLQVAETEMRRLLDPHHQTRLSRLDAVLRQLGKRLRVEVVDIAA